MLTWMNANAGALNVLFALVVALATVVYAGLTYSLERETKRLREVQTEPQLSIHTESSQFGLSLMNLVVQNAGAGAAFDVELTLDRDIEWMRGKKLSQRGLFKHPIRFMAPQQRIETFLLNALDHVSEGRSSLDHLSFVIKAKYHNGRGHERSEAFAVELEYLEELVGVGEVPIVSISRRLKGLETAITQIASGRTEFRVVSRTEEDDIQSVQGDTLRPPATTRRSSPTFGSDAG